MGLIVCQYCGAWIDEVETEKVTVLYGACRDESCRSKTRREEMNDG
ncbi:GapA-binding peptide SR1P [Paenibacillus flagellatus]|uniref:GapA-binding peptide SR1P n=1 Tax=Paenibacillus flagellatus TaxID=2211139 RepID=A0A2V5KKE1_9BACL|nr:GapA-binding peptide SR1P [Paenibacillus flagellatus]